MRKLLRLVRRSRPLVWWLLVSNRNLAALWFRSVRAEAGQPFSADRWVRLIRSLIRISGDNRLRNAPQIRAVYLTDSAVEADVDRAWQHAHLLKTVLGGVGRDPRVSLVDVSQAA